MILPGVGRWWSLVVVAVVLLAVTMGLPTAHADEAEAEAPAGVHAEDDPPVSTPPTCIAPDVLAKYEHKLEVLQGLHDTCTREREHETTEYRQSLAAVEDQLARERGRADETTRQLEAAKTDAAAHLAGVELQAGEAATRHAEVQHDLERKVKTLEKTIQELEWALSAEKEALVARHSEVSAAHDQLAQVTTQVQSLEQDVAHIRRTNAALRDQLARKDDKVTIAALLAALYDDSVVVVGDTVRGFGGHLTRAQAAALKASGQLGAYHTLACATTSRLYQEHLAATLDPLRTAVWTTTKPYVDAYAPEIMTLVAHVRKVTVAGYAHFQRQFWASRTDAITILHETETVGTHATTVVDTALVLLALPLGWLVLRLALRLVLWGLWTVLYVVTCGFCCGKCARRRPNKSKPRNKPPRMSGSVPAPSVTKTSVTKTPIQRSTNTTPVTTSHRRNKKKN